MRLIDADALLAEAMEDGAYGYVDAKQIADAPTIEPLTEIDYIELADRYGGEVSFVVRDMIEREDKRWGDKTPPKMDDVVCVVRCKNCRHYWKNGGDNSKGLVCLASPSDDAFCSEGERKQE